MENYYNRGEVSNSDLSALKVQLSGKEQHDPTEAYKFGSLIDIMITEPELVDYINYTAGPEQYTPDDFALARQMKKAFMRDDFAMRMLKNSDTQKIMIEQNKEFDYDVKFELSVRCKWDLWMLAFNWGGDIKSTTAKTQKQFEDACMFFDYDRQRYWYMNIAKSDQDVLIGISKENNKLFKIHIKRGDKFWKSGRDKALELAFKYWSMFGEI